MNRTFLALAAAAALAAGCSSTPVWESEPPAPRISYSGVPPGPDGPAADPVTHSLMRNNSGTQ